MRRATLTLFALLLAAGALADGADDVRQTEIAFAKAFADRDTAAFFAFVAEDARFFGPTRMLAGKKAVMEAWSKYLKDAKAPFSWRPERVAVNDNADLGLSTGPVFEADGTQSHTYYSIWQKQRDGSWKIVFDGPGPCVSAQK